jgi:hypothetical protein
MLQVQGANNSNSCKWQLQATTNSKELSAATEENQQQQGTITKGNTQQQGTISGNCGPLAIARRH